MAVSYLLSNVCLTYSAAFQGLSMGVQCMLLTLSRQVVLPVVFIAVLSRFGNLPLIWMALVLAEAVVIPFGMFFWRIESGKVSLGDFAPKFAQLNDDVLFGEVWSRENQLSLRDRSLITVVSLMAQGLTDSSFRYHLEGAKKNGITKGVSDGKRSLGGRNGHLQCYF